LILAAHVYTIYRVTVREVIQRLRADGWREVGQTGSHKQFTHPHKPGKVTVPDHRGDLAPGTLKSIWKQAGLT
jgi:predicted RNA binding protein YcfA (HicA-like mRNA interferase family)